MDRDVYKFCATQYLNTRQSTDNSREVIYVASNIKQNFLEMKNISELMVDLAYSALFLRDKHIAAEVEQLFERINQLEDDTTKLLFRIKENDEKRILILDLIEQVRTVSNAARHIAQLSVSTQVPSVIPEALRQTDERVIVMTVSPHSSLCDKSLKTSQVGTKTGARVLAIKRHGNWMFGINDDTLIQAGDQLVARGSKGAEERLQEWTTGKRNYLTNNG